jgi:hypothetical protein
MGGSAHAREKVQEGPLVTLDQVPESAFVPVPNPLHQGNVIGFGLDGIGHETALLNEFPPKEKEFPPARRRRGIAVNPAPVCGAYRGGNGNPDERM